MLSEPANALTKEINSLAWEEGIERLQALARSRNPRVGRLLVELVEHRSVWMREQALKALWIFGRLADARRAARIAINSKNYFVRDIAAEMMGEVGTKADVPALIEVLENEWWEVARTSAAESLGELRTKAGLAALHKAIYDDPSWLVRAHSVTSLCLNGEKKYRPYILERLREERDKPVHVSLYDALIRMGDEDAVERLIDFLFEDDPWYMVYIRVCVMLRGLYLGEGEPLPLRAVKGLKHIAKTQNDRASGWSAHDLLKEAGLPATRKKVPILESSGKSKA